MVHEAFFIWILIFGITFSGVNAKLQNEHSKYASSIALPIDTKQTRNLNISSQYIKTQKPRHYSREFDSQEPRSTADKNEIETSKKSSSESINSMDSKGLKNMVDQMLDKQLHKLDQKGNNKQTKPGN